MSWIGFSLRRSSTKEEALTDTETCLAIQPMSLTIGHSPVVGALGELEISDDIAASPDHEKYVLGNPTAN